MQSNCVKPFQMLVYLNKVYFVSGFFPVTIKIKTSDAPTTETHIVKTHSKLASLSAMPNKLSSI